MTLKKKRNSAENNLRENAEIFNDLDCLNRVLLDYRITMREYLKFLRCCDSSIYGQICLFHYIDKYSFLCNRSISGLENTLPMITLIELKPKELWKSGLRKV